MEPDAVEIGVLGSLLGKQRVARLEAELDSLRGQLEASRERPGAAG